VCSDGDLGFTESSRRIFERTREGGLPYSGGKIIKTITTLRREIKTLKLGERGCH